MISKSAMAWLASATVVTGAGGGGLYQLATSTGTSTSTSSSTSTSTGSAASSAANGGSNPGGGHAITVTWSVNRPLVLGAVGVLTASIKNTNNQAVLVQRVSAAVLGSSDPACDPRWLTVGSYAGSKRIEANTSGTVHCRSCSPTAGSARSRTPASWPRSASR